MAKKSNGAVRVVRQRQDAAVTGVNRSGMSSAEVQLARHPLPGAVDACPCSRRERRVDWTLPLTVTFVLRPVHAGIRKATANCSGCESAKCMLVSPFAGYCVCWVSETRATPSAAR